MFFLRIAYVLSVIIFSIAWTVDLFIASVFWMVDDTIMLILIGILIGYIAGRRKRDNF